MLRTSKLDKFAFIILQITLFLAPIFFIPSLSVPFQSGKTGLIIYGILIALVLWLIARLRDGVFNIPKSLWYGSAGLLALTYSASAIFSVNHATSFVGQSFEIGTLSFFLISIVLFFLVPLLTRTKEQIFYSYGAILLSFFTLAIFHISRFIFGVDFLSFGFLNGATSNLIGAWNDVGVFFGLVTLVTLVTLERAELSKVISWFVRIAFVVSLLMLAIIGFSPVWTMLALISLIFAVYELSFGKKEHQNKSRVPVYAIVTLVIAVFFMLGGSTLGSRISGSLGISQVEVRPSWGATWDVAMATLKTDPFFGVGANRFSTEWLMNKPEGINNTLFWNTDFNYGVGFIPSFITTSGIVGGLGILIFIGLFLWTAVRTLFKQGNSPFSRYLVLSSLFGSVYLWVFAIIYVPSAPIWILTLFLSGLFIASLREDGSIMVKEVSVIEKPAINFISVLLIIFALIASISFGYFVSTKLISTVQLQKGLILINSGDLDLGEEKITKAFNLSPSDVYAQYIAEIYLARLSDLYSKEGLSQTDAQALFQQYLAAAIQGAQSAVSIDPTNYQNHLTLGRVFESVVPLEIKGAYDSAKQSYESALKFNPENPEIYLLLARLETANKDNKAAQEYIAKSLEKKSDYAEAIYFLSQIQVSEGNLPEAIKSVEAVATLSPSDSGVFFQLGLLYYSEKQYSNSVLAFTRAINLNPQYANAKYFLGLSLHQTKDLKGSLKQFKDLMVSNPDSEEVKAIIVNLEAGKEPLDGIQSNSANLPIEESTTKEKI